ncbi:MAG TPA: DUF72 domain-containing protein [Hyphomicrobium sp.]|nr:DUF72 domain-containing protein [Hyphomicrobium sp.]
MAGGVPGGEIRVGVGGWTFEPWRGVFYPEGLPHKRELEFASRALTSIEINGTYYSTFKPQSWRNWRDETPDDFMFAVKGSRYVTNRKVLAGARASIDKFLCQGLTELGDKLGPVNWQLMPAKKFDPADMAAFFELLPESHDGLRLRHAIEVRHPSFATPEFYALARAHGVAVVYASGSRYPSIDQSSGGFTYARHMGSDENIGQGYSDAALKVLARQARGWARKGDVFLYFISGAKVRNPTAASALIARLKKAR